MNNSINVIYHINKWKDKNHMIISVEAKKASDTHLWLKKKNKKHNSPENQHRRNLPQYNKGHLQPTANIILNGEKLKALPLRSGIRQGCPVSPLLFNVALEVPATAIREEK